MNEGPNKPRVTLRTTGNMLMANEAKYRKMIAQNPLMCFELDPAGTIISANNEAVRQLGFDAEELVGHPVTLVFPEDRHDAVLGQLDICVQEPQRVHKWEGIKRRKDGSLLWVGESAISLMEENQDPIILVMCENITERKNAEKQIAEHARQLEESMRDTLLAVSNMVEHRDPYTAGHERRVGIIAGDIARDIAREMGWPVQKCKYLQLIGLVHDIGKIGVPAEILSKPGRLTSMEYELVKGHAERGYEILKDVKFPLPIAEIIRQHHERMDGSGYPRGLKGEEILPEARLLAVADVMESMSSHRPYRQALGSKIALQELVDHRGTLYDAGFVDALVRLMKKKKYQLPT